MLEPVTAPSRRIAIIGAQTAIGISPHREGRPQDLRLPPRVLREEGVVRRLRAAGDVTTGDPYRDLARPARRMRNAKEVARHSLRLARRVEKVVAKGAFPLALGGDCSIFLGCLLGLRRRGAVGLVYVDVHADFASLDESASRSACSMSLALATGRVREPAWRPQAGCRWTHATSRTSRAAMRTTPRTAAPPCAGPRSPICHPGRCASVALPSPRPRRWRGRPLRREASGYISTSTCPIRS